MKQLFFTLVLTIFVSLAHGQGTIAFGNSALTRVQILFPNGTFRNATAADGLNFYVFFGPAGTTADALTQVQQPDPKAAIGTTPGVMINAPSVFALPGTEPGQIVSLQIKAWNVDRSLCLETRVIQVTLAPTAGPGAVIWQTATGTNPNRFTPMIICPEPSAFALGALGGLLLLFFRRKSTRN